MTHMTDQVRETFGTVGREVPVPAFDEVAFRAQVRRARRRRTGRAVLATGVAAGVVSVALLAVPPLLDGAGDGDGDGSRPAPPVAGRNLALEPSVLPQPLYYVAGRTLFAATPDGEVHDLGPSESVVGHTAEGVLATDDESGLVWTAAESSGEGDGTYTFAEGAGPVSLPRTGPVQSAALSLDGRWLAWLDLEDQVTMWDLKAGELVYRAEVPRNAYVTSVSGQGVLASLNGNLTLLGTSFDVSVPTEKDGYGWVSDLAGDWVTVADRDDVTRVYDVTQEEAKLVDSVPGTGRLAPYAKGIVSVSTEENQDGMSGEAVLYMADGEPRTLAGIEGIPQTAGWLDERYALVTAAEAGGTVVYLCPVAEDDCTPVAFSETDVRLGD